MELANMKWGGKLNVDYYISYHRKFEVKVSKISITTKEETDVSSVVLKISVS